MKKQIQALRGSVSGLTNDERYWDLCRTYGDYSREVLRHLQGCARAQAADESHT